MDWVVIGWGRWPQRATRVMERGNSQPQDPHSSSNTPCHHHLLKIEQGNFVRRGIVSFYSSIPHPSLSDTADLSSSQLLCSSTPPPPAFPIAFAFRDSSLIMVESLWAHTLPRCCFQLGFFLWDSCGRFFFISPNLLLFWCGIASPGGDLGRKFSFCFLRIPLRGNQFLSFLSLGWVGVWLLP